MSPLITLNIPSILFEFAFDEVVKQIDVNIRIKRVIIKRCASEGDIFEFSEFKKVRNTNSTKPLEEKSNRNASSFRFEALGFTIIFIIGLLVLPFFYDAVLFNGIWTTVCSIILD